MRIRTADIFDSIEETSVQLRTQTNISADRILRLTLSKIPCDSPAPRRGLRGGRIFLFAAVVSALLLGTTVFAYVGFTKYENPVALLNVFFGNTSFVGNEGGEEVISYPNEKEVTVTYPTVERVPIDETVAQEYVAPYILDVNQSVSLNGYTLTVIAHQYDSAIGSGIIYYMLENPEGILDYKILQNHEIWWPNGSPVQFRMSNKEYMIDEETTQTALAVACYYMLPLSFENTRVSIGLDEIHSINLELNDGGGVHTGISADGNILVSPTGIKMCLDDMVFLGVIDTDGTYIPPRDDNRITYLSVVFKNEEEFIILQDREGTAIANYAQSFIRSYFPTYVSYTFNRMIDIENVKAVRVNDVCYTVTPPGDKETLKDQTDGAVCVGGAAYFEEISYSKEEEAKGKGGAIDEGKLKHRILGARLITNINDIPKKGGFFDYSSESVYTIKGNELLYRYPDLIQEDGSFPDGVRMLLVDVEITSEDAENWTVDTWPRGLYEDPYVFSIDGMYWLRENRAWNGERCRQWSPDYFSGKDEEREHPFAYRILPGQTRQFTVGFLIGGYPDGTVIPLEALSIRVPYGYDGCSEEQLFQIG